MVGDSLSAEYGLKRGSGWVALLEKKLTDEKMSATVVNASISGDTTSGGLARLNPLLVQHKPSLVVIELGGNDALRGLALELTQTNLVKMTRAAQGAGAKVLLLGMQMPPNYGRDSTQKFASISSYIFSFFYLAIYFPFFLLKYGWLESRFLSRGTIDGIKVRTGIPYKYTSSFRILKYSKL